MVERPKEVANIQQKLFQVSTFSALQQGDYEGDFQCENLASRGNFGLGLINRLDAGMVIADGEFYCFSVDGTLSKLVLQRKTPYAMVTNFRQAHGFPLPAIKDYQSLKTHIYTHLGSNNHIYAVKVEAEFKRIKLRVLRPQKEPFPPLEKVWEEQAVFDLVNVGGIMAGFYFPKHMAYINMVGYHFHFMSSHRCLGGHVLDIDIKEGIGYIHEIHYLDIYIPSTNSFAALDFNDIRLTAV
jgi:acetolactate decarboxylase